MMPRAAQARRPALLPAALLTAATALAACSAPGNEVIFEGAAPETTGIPVTTAAPAASSPPSEAAPRAAAPAETEPPPPAADPSGPASPGADAAQPGRTAAGPPAPLVISEQELDLATMQMAVNGPSGRSVTVFGPDDEQVDLYADAGELVSQPTWSPNGRLVAWASVSASGASVSIGRAEGGPVRSYETPFAVYYMQWRPDGQALGVLGSPDAARVALAILDLDRNAVIPMNSAASYYFHWAPEGNELITHLGQTSLALLDPDTGDASPLEAAVPANSNFQAAAWTDEGRSIIYVRPAAPGGEEPGNPEEQGDELVIHDLDTGEIEVVGAGAGYFNFSLSPDGESVAYSIQNLGTTTAMRVVDLATGRTEEVDAPDAFAWQWSPDSSKILLLGAGDSSMTVGVYESGNITRYQNIIPTNTFLRSYLLFWGQYDLSHDLWAPDSSGFVYAAFDRNADYVFFQPLDEENPILVGPGSMAAFSPAFSPDFSAPSY